MFGKFSEVKIYVKPGATDFRKSINGLAVMAEETMKQEAMSGNFFIFCNKSRNRMKVLYWDRNGFCLWMKRLEENKFPWPNSEEEAREISREEFSWLLRGIDFWNQYKKIQYTRVS
jgi:transposase